MKEKILRLKTALRAVMFILMMGVVGITKGYAYSFSAVCETGQTLYYNIISGTNEVRLTYPGTSDTYWSGYTKPTGNLVIPSTVTYNSTVYTVTAIKDETFAGCTGLTSITVPNTITTIGEMVFSYCTGLTSPVYNNTLFMKMPTSYSGSYSIPSGITTICYGAFYECAGLTQVSIPNTVTRIEESAFEQCIGLASVIIPNSVVYIVKNAFKNCSALTSVTIGKSVTSIGANSFNNCSNLSNLTMGNSVQSIGKEAFMNCSSLTSVVIPNSVNNIYARAFCDCSSLASVTLGNSITSIETAVFCRCTALTSIQLPSSLVSIKLNAFSNSGLTSINTNSVSSIEQYAFSGCSDLESVAFGNDLSSIGNYAFYECTNLTSITFGGGLSTIGESAFRFCSHLSSIILPNSVMTIARYAFADCSALASVAIGNSVTSLGEYAFGNCTGLTSLTMQRNNPPSITSWTFQNVSNTILVAVPCGSMEAYQSAQYWSSFTNYHESCLEIIATANPAEGGTVTGVGYFEEEATCTLSAIPNQGFTFVNWTENNMIISSDAVYTFEVTDERTFTANFESVISFADANVKTICVAHWDVNSDGELSYAEAANVTNIYSYFKGSDIVSFDELQYFTGLTSINEKAFQSCTSLVSVIIPNSVTQLDKRSFENTALTSIEIPNSITYIDNNAFRDCTELTSIVIPNSVSGMGKWVFYNCTSLTSISIPNSITIINNYAFYGCNSLTSVILPNTVTSINWGAFDGCSGLTTLTVLAKTPPVLDGDYVFEGVTKTIPVRVPCGSVALYQTAGGWSEFSNYQELECSSYTVEGYGSGSGKWVFIASPVVEDLDPTTVTNLIGGGTVGNYDYDLFRYNPSAALGWENYVTHTDGFVLQNGKGYLYAREETADIEFIGTLNTGTTKTVALNQGWNLVGNPFVTAVNVNKPFYRMNETGTDIEPVSAYSTTDIPACNGVVVKATGTSETVTFTQSSSKASVGDSSLQMTLAKTGLRGNEIQDKAIVSFNEDAQLEKFVFNEDHAKLYIFQDDEDFAIAFSERKSEIPVHFIAKELGTYTISFSGENMSDIKLVDKLENVIIDLGVNDSYTFIGSPADSRDRFRLVFGDAALSTGSETEVFAYQNGNDIIVNGEGELHVFDVMGHMVATQQINGVQSITMPQGVYIFRLEGKTQKIVIR
jgi:hypothetical protein